MTPADSSDFRPPWAMLIIHGAWLVFIAVCGFSMTEVRTTWLGGTLLIGAVAVIALALLSELLRWKKISWWGDRGRAPRFTLHAIAGIIALACAAFGIVACFNLPLPNEALFHFGNNNGPMSRWVFLVGVVYGFTALYGFLAVIIGSGLWDSNAKEANPPMTQVEKPKEESV